MSGSGLYTNDLYYAMNSIRNNLNTLNIVNIQEVKTHQLYNFNDENLILVQSNTNISDFTIEKNKLIKNQWNTQFGQVDQKKMENVVAYDKFKVK